MIIELTAPNMAMIKPFKVEFEEHLSAVLNQKVIIHFTVFDGRTVNSNIVMDLVSKHLNISPNAIMGKGRTTAVVTARMCYCYLCRTMLRQTLTQIAKSVNRDHTTAINACKVVQGYIDVKDPIVFPLIIELIEKLKKAGNEK